ncbi:MAG: hypothetical protein KAQ93_03255 [Spirochaetales bacterium]|nr:hypothetical protein [Spirochaetales bacterium]
MISKIPLPTDNLYKFIALFGLMIFLTTLVMFFTRHQYYNESAFNRYKEISNLKIIEDRTEKEEIELFILTEQQQIEETDEDLEVDIYIITAVIGIFLIFVGFFLWYLRVQKYQDLLLILRVRKAKIENKSIITNANCRTKSHNFRVEQCLLFFWLQILRLKNIAGFVTSGSLGNCKPVS